MAALLEFFHMGGYGVYVWAAYGAATLFMVGGLLWLLRRKRQLLVQKR